MLFQGRFNSCVVDSDAYVLNVIRHIELNPVRLRLASNAKDWRWFSVYSDVRSVTKGAEELCDKKLNSSAPLFPWWIYGNSNPSAKMRSRPAGAMKVLPDEPSSSCVPP